MTDVSRFNQLAAAIADGESENEARQRLGLPLIQRERQEKPPATNVEAIGQQILSDRREKPVRAEAIRAYIEETEGVDVSDFSEDELIAFAEKYGLAEEDDLASNVAAASKPDPEPWRMETTSTPPPGFGEAGGRL